MSTSELLEPAAMNKTTEPSIVVSRCNRPDPVTLKLRRRVLFPEGLTRRPADAQRLGIFSVEEILAYVEQRLRCKLSLNAVSKLVGLSRAAFTRCFRASVGMSFHRYLVKRRVELAKRMLQDTDDAVHPSGAAEVLPRSPIRCPSVSPIDMMCEWQPIGFALEVLIRRHGLSICQLRAAFVVHNPLG